MRGLWALAFVAVSLLALVAVPVIFGHRVDVVQTRITDVLEPAARLSSNIRLLKARQMARMEGYLATDDEGGAGRAFRDPYRAAAREEASTLEELQGLAPLLDAVPAAIAGPTFFERVAGLQRESLDWHFANERIFEGGRDPEARDRVLAGYNDLQLATRDLDAAIQAEVGAGRRRVALERRRQSVTLMVLALVALFATVVVGRVAYRYWALTIEGEKRRVDAVRARREIDALLEATGDGVLGIDLDGRCTSLNRAGVALLGYTEAEIRNRDVHATLFHSAPDGEPVDRDDSVIIRAINNGAPVRSEEGAIMWRRRRIAFPARWSLHPMVDGTVLRGAVLTFTDMTEIREKEEALRRAVRQREDVVSIVSHDLRNPLGVALASADLILDLPLDEQQRRRQAEIIRRSGKRMQRLIEDLLDVARMEAGALVVRPSREELQPILEEARELFLDQAEDRSIDLSVLPCDNEPTARVDRDRILQGLSNLLDNAIRLTPEGGAVSMQAEDEGDDVLISVSDTGPGIAPEVVDYLFDRFSQGEEVDRGAAGLGLSIVKGVAAAHGGEVSVVSMPGQGSVFTMRIPKDGRGADGPAIPTA